MAVVTKNTVDIRCIREDTTLEHKLFGRTREVVTKMVVPAQIHTYYALCKDDNDEVLQNLIDSINRISIDIGTDFDKLALKALEAQPEYVVREYDGLERKSCRIQGVYYRPIFRENLIEFTPLYYWWYLERDVIPVELSDLDRGDVTKDIKDFIDNLKETYSYYVKLYESKKEK